MAEFQVAAPAQLDDVLSVLNEAATWLHARGVNQWPERFEPSWVAGALGRGETWLVSVDGTLSGTVTLDWSDPIWSDAGGAAAYLHRMAVRRAAAGLGAAILAWAADAARRHGRTALRLDCVASNSRLRAYYEAAGSSTAATSPSAERPASGWTPAPPSSSAATNFASTLAEDQHYPERAVAPVHRSPSLPRAGLTQREP